MLTTLLLTQNSWRFDFMDVNNLLEYAINESKLIVKDEIFLVKELFKGYEWNRIPRKDRLLLGTLFLNHINKLNGTIVPIEKTSSGQQKYKKLR